MVDQESPVWGNLVGAHWAQRGQRSDGGLIQAIKAWAQLEPSRMVYEACGQKGPGDRETGPILLPLILVRESN